VSGDFAEQVRQTLRNLETILEGSGTSLSDVVKMNCYLTDATRFTEFNRIYTEFFPGPPPARTTISCQLIGILVEIDCVAVVPSSKE
jgi:2-iminobutanoate/2-iminopropanoate deaminase